MQLKVLEGVKFWSPRIIHGIHGIFYESLFFKENGPLSYHAECSAIRKIRRLNLKSLGAVMIVVRVNRKNELMPSEPCDYCRSKLQKLGIRVYYS